MPRVQVVSPDGVRGSVEAKDVSNLPDGARILTKEELAQEKVETEYAGASTGSKVAGAVLGVGAKNPQLEAWYNASTGALTGGAQQAITKTAADAIKPGAGKAYAERVDELETAYPGTTTAGAVGGTLGGIAIGMAGGASAGAGAARALPMNAASALGAPIEHGVTRALGGLAARGALGKAATQGAAMAVRGAAEGAAYAGFEQVTSDILHDSPTTGEKLYAAAGHGALLGGGLGGALGAGGSLAGSAARGLVGRSTRAAGALGVIPEIAPRAGVEVPFINADAGLRGPRPSAMDVFSVGAEQRPIQLRPGGRPSVKTESPIDISGRLAIDPDAGLHAPRGKTTEPIFSRDLRTEELFTPAAEERPVRLAGDAFKTGEKVPATSRPVRQRFDIGLDPDAGLAGGPERAEDAFRLSSAKEVPRRIDTSLADDVSKVEGRSPIKLPEVATPTDAVRGLAHDQAWRAVGGGFGLQTTRYAKEAAKYFPGGTKDLGEVAMRYGLIDTGEAAGSPLAAAWQAAKSGTPAEIAPRAAAASDTVGQKIGNLTDASGARIPLSKVIGTADEVAQFYRGRASQFHLGNAAHDYGEQLTSVLRPSRDGTVSVQDVLAQRKILDESVFDEAKTLDPKGRIKALREVRGKLESVITDALEEASDRVPGATRAEYNTLKRDYHALRILSEAAEDSAARSSKASMFGLGEKFAIASSVASGNIGAAPVLAVGGKMIRERGNAAAAAFLSRASEQGTFEKLVKQFDMRVSKAAMGAIEEPKKLPARVTEAESRPTPARAMVSREVAKQEAQAKQTKAQAVMKWVGDFRANPERILEQVQEAAAIVGRSAGPKAAESYTASTVRAIRFIAAHIPIKERRDPLDPRSVPPLMQDEADTLLQATKYGLQPMTVFDDFERGVITPVGLRAAQTLVPDSFLEFQLQLQEHVQNHMLHNRQLTMSQRLRIDKLLGYPAGADLRPQAISRLQANLSGPDEGSTPAPQGNAGPTPAPLNMQIQQTGFDSIEARRAG